MANVPISATSTTCFFSARANGQARTGNVVQATTTRCTFHATARAGYAPIIRATSTRCTFGISGTPTVDVAAAVPLPIGMTATVRCLLRLDGQKMDLDRLVTQVYNLWGMEVTSGRNIEFARGRVLEIINGALQIIYSKAEKLDYFNRETITLTFGTGVTTQKLPVGVQNILGPVKLGNPSNPTNIALRNAGTVSEFENWLDLYFAAAAGPRVAFIDRRSSGTGFDSQACVLRIGPAPTDETDVSLDYAAEAPYYRETDYAGNARLKVPHSYVESLLLPIVKYNASLDSLFRREEMREALTADYRRALAQLGMVDPDPVPQRNAKPSAPASSPA
jgi:hypothetical protein